jgi:chromosome segregation ATPase
MITPSSGVPKPTVGSKDPKKTNNATQAVYRGREMDEMARKKREDAQRQLILQKRALEIKQMDLRAQEERQNSLRREITELENQSRGHAAVGSKSVSGIENTERKVVAKIAENEKEIKTLEQEELKLKNETLKLSQDLETKKQEAGKASQASLALAKQAEDHQRSIQGKTQEAVLAVNRIAAIKQEIKMIQSRIQDLERNYKNVPPVGIEPTF